jgi:hypothetical protein
MTLSSSTRRWDYIGNGTASSFSYDAKIFTEDEVEVTVKNTTTDVETTLTLTTDYTVTGQGEASGGTVVLVDSGQAWLDGDGDLASGYTLTIRRVPPLEQETDLRNQGDYYPEVVEDQLDKLVMICLFLQEQLDRTMKVPVSSTAQPQLPEPQDGYVPGWSGTDGTMVNREYDTTSLNAAVTAAEGHADDAETFATNASGSADAAAISASAASDSADAAADSASNAADSETNAANSAASIPSPTAQTFDNGDLSGGVYTYNHALSSQYGMVQVFDNNNNMVIPDEITLTDANNLAVDLSSYGSITGTWRVIFWPV